MNARYSAVLLKAINAVLPRPDLMHLFWSTALRTTLVAPNPAPQQAQAVHRDMAIEAVGLRP